MTGPAARTSQAGSGLQGLADRVGAIDGRLSVESPARTRHPLVADLPVAP